MRMTTTTLAVGLVAALVAALLVGPTAASAQCSDAGVCAVRPAMPAAGPSSHGDATAPAVNVTALSRLGMSGQDDDLTYTSVEVAARAALAPSTSLSARLPWRRSSGPQGAVAGIGDLLVLVEQRLGRPGRLTAHVTVGLRLPTGDDNADPLFPQAYQPGLGTTDVLAGLGLRRDAWSFSLGYQHAGSAFTGNTLTPIKRGSDLYAQAGFTHRLGDLAARVDLQAIQRLAATELRTGDGSVVDVDGSDQLQVNAGLEVRYPIGRRTGLEGGIAMPLRSRASNVDGLQRALTVWAGLRLGA